MPKINGNSSKDSKYLARIKKAIADDKNHPRNNNLKMQAHHIISAEGMRLSGIGKKTEKTGYDINCLNNLAFIPCTLQGACFLGIQPHRGNHNASVDQDDYVDDMEPPTYHEMVGKLLRDLVEPIMKNCLGEKKENSNEVLRELDILSKKILGLIQYKPRMAPLTKIAKHFGHGDVGCSGVDSITGHSSTRHCPVSRQHRASDKSVEKSHSAMQANENISFDLAGKYKLQVGK
jgi:hypothetical protein